MHGTKLKNYQKKVHQKIEIMFNFIYLKRAIKKEIHFNFNKEIPLKKSSPKIEIAFKFT